MVGETEQQLGMSGTAYRLKMVRQAYERFLALAAVDCIMDSTTRINFVPASDETDREGADHHDALSAADLSALFRDGALDD